MSIAVKDMIQMARTQLENNGRENAKTDAEMIFRHLMGVDKLGFFKLWGETLDDDICDRYLDLISIRADGTPLQYITGEQEFMGFEFKVNSKVLIPRQDTEVLVAEAVSVINEKKKRVCSVLDMGCGSGAIGISIVKLCDNAKVTASDISEDILETAKRNAKALKADRKMSFVLGSLYEPFKTRFRVETFDVIVSNPPYIESGAITLLQTEIKDHEPLLALDGGPDGLSYYRKILPGALGHLKKGGTLILEIGSDQAGAVRSIAEECGGFRDFRVVRDLAGCDRVVVFEYGSN